MHGSVLLIPLGHISLDYKVHGDLSPTLNRLGWWLPADLEPFFQMCCPGPSQMWAYILFIVILKVQK